MCPPGHIPTADIGAFWTDEDLIFCLDKIQHGSSLPENVVADVNPFEYEPSNLPDDVWFIVGSDNQIETKSGSWKVRGKECEVYSDSKLTGWRTTFEFYEGQSENGLRTDWMMQKYWITQKESNNVKASGSLYRVFSCDGGCTKQKRQRCLLSGSLGNKENASLEQESRSMSRNGSAEKAQDDVRQDETKSIHPDQYQDDADCISAGDYLELLDLVNPSSSSSSSDNSSCVSMASDEVFDYLALLNDLESDNTEDIQSKSTSLKFSVAMFSIPREVLVPPATSGSLVTGEVDQPSGDPLTVEHPSPNTGLNEKVESQNATKRAGKSHMSKNVTKPLPKSDEASTSQVPIPEKGKKIASGKMKLLRKKYLCFMPF